MVSSLPRGTLLRLRYFRFRPLGFRGVVAARGKREKDLFLATSRRRFEEPYPTDAASKPGPRARHSQDSEGVWTQWAK